MVVVFINYKKKIISLIRVGRKIVSTKGYFSSRCMRHYKLNFDATFALPIKNLKKIEDHSSNFN